MNSAKISGIKAANSGYSVYHSTGDSEIDLSNEETAAEVYATATSTVK